MNSMTPGPDAEEYEALLQFLYIAPVGLVQLEADGAILMLNPLASQLLMPLSSDGGLSNLFEALAPVVPDLRSRCASFTAPSGQICDALRLYLHAGHGGGPQVLSLSLLKLDHGRLMAVLNDITAQEQRERQMRNTDAWLNAIMTNIADYALVTLDHHGMIASWNASIGRVTGFDAAGVEGQPYTMFYPVDASTPEQQLDRLREADDNGWTLEEGLRRRADGSEFWGSSMISPLPATRDERNGEASLAEGEPAYCMIMRDISDKREHSERLREATFCDHLTGLANRRAFFEAADLELTRRQRAVRPIALLMLDADHFKAINDNHGHPAGDAVLRHLADSMRAVCRQVDVVARIGGEEFGLLLPSVGLQEALAVAERLRVRVQQSPAIYEQKSIHYTVSIGVAMMEDEVGGLDGLMKLADQALYLAKRGGRNQVACWPAGVPARLEQGA